jgi:hypothetical protein
MTAAALLLLAALAQPSTTPAGPPAPAPPAAWSGTAGAGLIWLTGNSRSVTFTLGAAAERKGARWIVSGKAAGAYGRSRAAGDGADQVVAEAAGGQLRVDRRLGERSSVYLLGVIDADHVNSVELRTAGELGATATWIDRGTKDGWNVYLRNDAGFRITEERRFQYYPAERALGEATLYSPRLGVAFRYQPRKGLTFTEDAEVLPSVGAGRVRVNSVSKLASSLIGVLSVGLTYTVAHDSAPAPGKVGTDTTLALLLEATL